MYNVTSTGASFPLSMDVNVISLSAGLEVDRISLSVWAPNMDKWALSADIRFRPKAVVPHSVHFQFQRAAVGKLGGCRK